MVAGPAWYDGRVNLIGRQGQFDLVAVPVWWQGQSILVKGSVWCGRRTSLLCWQGSSGLVPGLSGLVAEASVSVSRTNLVRRHGQYGNGMVAEYV